MEAWGIEYKYDDGSWKLEFDFIARTKKAVIAKWMNAYGWVPENTKKSNARAVRIVVKKV